MAQNDAASRLVDPETAGGNGDSQASSPASDPQIEALLQACAAAGAARRRDVVWRSLASGDERLMGLTAEPREPDLVVLTVEDRGGDPESRRKLAVMHALAEISAGCAGRVAFLANTARLLQGYLGTDQVSFCENARASDDPEIQEVPVRAEGASLGLLRIRAPAPMDAFTLEFLETLGNLMGETLRRIDQETLLSDTEEYYQLLAASTDSAIVIFDAQGRIRGWNAAAEKMYEYSASEVVGRSCAVLYSEEDVARGKPEDDLRRARQKGGLPGRRSHPQAQGRRAVRGQRQDDRAHRR